MEACLLPHVGAHDRQAPFPSYLVASLDPAAFATPAACSAVASNTGAVAFALSWQALAASGALPGGPHAVVLFVQALPRASFVTKPLTASGCLDSAALACLSHHGSPCGPPRPLTSPPPFFSAAIAPQPVYDDAQDEPMADAVPSPPRTPPRANANGQQPQFYQFHQPQQLQQLYGCGGGGLWF